MGLPVEACSTKRLLPKKQIGGCQENFGVAQTHAHLAGSEAQTEKERKIIIIMIN